MILFYCYLDHFEDRNKGFPEAGTASFPSELCCQSEPAVLVRPIQRAFRQGQLKCTARPGAISDAGESQHSGGGAILFRTLVLNTPLTFRDRALRRPQSLWLRKALFQIHLWTGIGVGLYVLLISVSGSAIVFRNELYKGLWPGPKLVPISGPRLSREEIKKAVHQAWPHYSIQHNRSIVHRLLRMHSN